MKKDLIKYYSLFVSCLFLKFNFLLHGFKVEGVIYNIVMVLVIIANAIIVIKYKNDIKYKDIAIIILLVSLIYSKDIYNFIFVILNIIILFIVEIKNSKVIKTITIILLSIAGVFGLLFILFPLPFTFISYIAFDYATSEEKSEPTLYCDNNYYVYLYSAGAMDSWHYNVAKHYDILDIDGIITITYESQIAKSQDEYNEFVDKYNCN
ncbi:MAG: hypothetical protein J1F35_03810 [Erysipelotrichales bacterium]|nr:hypothetical protein [Erysipelotrichales bacterium]